MFDKLGEKRRPASTPEGASLFAIGDIHGRADLLEALLRRLDDEGANAPGARIIFLGDYIDRGPDSRAVIARLIALRNERPATIFLKGNHEDRALAFVAAPEAHADWLDWGGAETLVSYGVAQPETRPSVELGPEFAAAAPASHLEFLRSLELSAEIGDYFFAHAGVRPGVPLELQEAQDLLWIRELFHSAPRERRPEKVIVHGHHPVRRPVDFGWRIAVDTGAVYGGKLTAVALQGTKRRFISV